MTARTLVLPIALLGLSTMAACDRPLSSPTTSSSVSVTSDVGAVGASIQDTSGQALLLFDGSLTQLATGATTQNSGATLSSFNSTKTINWSTACREGGTRGVSGTVTVSANNGSGVVNTDLLVSFTNCDVGRVTLLGNPGISLKGQTTFEGGIPDTHTFQKTGGGLFTVQDGLQGSVRFNCMLTWSRQSGEVSSTGTVSWEYPIGTPVPGPGCRG